MLHLLLEPSNKLMIQPAITVRNSSRIYIGSVQQLLAPLTEGRRVVMVTDERVASLYPTLFAPYPTICIGQGEEQKNLQTVERIHRQLIELGADRTTFIVAVGGGIVTDTAGFAAATYMRGVAFGFVSTTLLGQVDASVGGKNGVNVGGYKNMAGTFTQPQFVICDPAMLTTLPERELRAGIAEVVKSAVIGDVPLFERLERCSFEALCRDPHLLADAVLGAVQVKAAIVERDEREAGDRKLLNLGHTLAHAIEKCSRAMNHGEAVAVGMRLVADASVRAGWLDASVRDRICGLLARLGFVLDPPVPVEQLLGEVGKDKKSAGDRLSLVVPRAIGQCEVILLEKTALAELFL